MRSCVPQFDGRQAEDLKLFFRYIQKTNFFTFTEIFFKKRKGHLRFPYTFVGILPEPLQKNFIFS